MTKKYELSEFGKYRLGTFSYEGELLRDIDLFELCIRGERDVFLEDKNNNHPDFCESDEILLQVFECLYEKAKRYSAQINKIYDNVDEINKLFVNCAKRGYIDEDELIKLKNLP